MPVVHSVAQNGFGAGTNELYDKARPSYQANAISYIRGSLRTSPPLNVVEIGAGTGIFTRALLAHPEWASTIKELVALEPSSGMREVFNKTVLDDRVSAKEGTFDNTGVEDGWADVVIIAQAFHWCPDFDKASTEFARILKPNGVLVLIWNLEDRDRARWVAALRDRIELYEAGTPQFRHGLWRETFDTEAYQRLFEAPEEKTWAYTVPATLQLALDRAASKSYIQILSEEERAKALEDVKAVVTKGEDKVWIDESKGTFEYPYQTFVVVARKI